MDFHNIDNATSVIFIEQVTAAKWRHLVEKVETSATKDERLTSKIHFHLK